MRSKRWAVRGARVQGDSASRGMHGGLPHAGEARRTAENTGTQAYPLSAGARSPAARGGSQRARARGPTDRARGGGQDGQLFPDKEAREVRFEQANARIAARGRAAPGVEVGGPLRRRGSRDF